MSKIALITGANKGLGFETARQLGQQGFTVLLGVREVEARFGVLDVLINNAGMLHPGDFAPPAQV